jgi:hypothetical protein
MNVRRPGKIKHSSCTSVSRRLRNRSRVVQIVNALFMKLDFVVRLLFSFKFVGTTCHIGKNILKCTAYYEILITSELQRPEEQCSTNYEYIVYKTEVFGKIVI